MGFFSALKSLGNAVVDTVLIPVDVAVDLATAELDDPKTVKRVNKIADELEEAYDQTLDKEDP
jgi:hypothetical protein